MAFSSHPKKMYVKNYRLVRTKASNQSTYWNFLFTLVLQHSKIESTANQIPNVNKVNAYLKAHGIYKTDDSGGGKGDCTIIELCRFPLRSLIGCLCFLQNALQAPNDNSLHTFSLAHTQLNRAKPREIFIYASNFLLFSFSSE